MNAPSSRVLLIGVGNEFRSDDGVGLRVARTIREMRLPGIEVIEQNGEGTSLIEAWSASARVILVDAASSGAIPGTIHRVDAGGMNLPNDLRLYSSHAFGVARAVDLARSMNRLPEILVIFAVEGKSFGFGSDLSADVESKLPDIVATVVAEIDSYQSKSH